jgi:hypothetical protein
MLLRAQGSLPWTEFTLHAGEIRAMGPGRRDREKPWRDPVSSSEALWYRALIGRTFSETPGGLQEFAFIARDLIPLLPPPPAMRPSALGQPADPPPTRVPATSSAVDDATTLLAALRRKPHLKPVFPEEDRSLSPYFRNPAATAMLVTLLLEAGLLVGPPLQPDPELARAFLEMPRAHALRTLLRAWVTSAAWNDLAHVPQLGTAKDEWPNDPGYTRRGALALLREIPEGSWWDLSSFLIAVKERNPGFQRPAGNFDAWYLLDTTSGIYLRGFQHWDAVEGALIRHLLEGPLHWLGAVDLGVRERGATTLSFRLTPAAAALFDPDVEIAIKESTAVASVRPDGRILVPRRAVRALRYQIARFTEWEPFDAEIYPYRLSPAGLNTAAEQGLELDHIQRILETAAEQPLPENLLRALDRWREQGQEAHFARELILHVSHEALLDELSADSTTSRFLGQRLGPTSAAVRVRDWKPLVAAAARLGVLLQPPDSGGGPP